MLLKLKKKVSKPIQGWVDIAHAGEIAGWAAHPDAAEEPAWVAIWINGERIATLKACRYREDLHRTGVGDGRKGFSFAPAKYLRTGDNRVVVSHPESAEPLPNGEHEILNLDGGIPAGAQSVDDLGEAAQLRWKGDEDEARLTWGTIMTGDSFVDVMLRNHQFTGRESLLEIGPGYGRLLTCLQERRVPFAKYLGLELSPIRVERLAQKFPSPGIRFVTGDILTDTFGTCCDVVLCSSTFEHLFPSMEKALQNIYKMSRKGTKLFIDFILTKDDDDLKISRAYFEHTSAYIRTYARAELEALFSEAGFRPRGIEKILLGQGSDGHDVRRALVIAERCA